MSPRGHTTWAAGEIERFIELYRDGFSVNEIALKLKKTKGQVCGRLYRMVANGLTRREQPPAWPEDKVLKLKHLYQNGACVQDIAMSLRVTRHSAQAKITKLIAAGMSRRPRMPRTVSPQAKSPRPRVVVPMPDTVTVFYRSLPKSCRFICDDLSVTADMSVATTCAEKALDGTSYCQFHYDICRRAA